MLTRNTFAASRLALGAVLALSVSLPAFAQVGPGGPRPRTPVVVEPATADEIKWLTYMREEEKLARDVYRYLYEKWNYTLFDRIAQSEQNHFNVVGTTLQRYGIADPAQNDVPGVFVNEKLNALYAELTAKGAGSLREALEVGVLIEKTDIEDLQVALSTTKFDIKRVYTNLMTASFQHLDSFEAYLELVEQLN